MRKFDKEQIHSALMRLPNELHDLVLSDTINTPLKLAMDSAKLSGEQREQVSGLSTCVLVDIISVDDFARAVENDLGLASDVAQGLIEAIKHSVISPMQDARVKASGQKNSVNYLVSSHASIAEVLRATRNSRLVNNELPLVSLLSKTTQNDTTIVHSDVDPRITERWRIVPHSIRNAILDHEYKVAVRNATSEYVLPRKSIDALEEEVLMTLLGLQTKAEFATYLPSIEGLTARDAERVAKHIDEHFFALLSPYLDDVSADSLQKSDTPPQPFTSGGEKSTPPQPSPKIGEGDDERLLPNPPLVKGREQPLTSTAFTERGGTTSPLEQFISKQADVSERFARLPEGVRGAILSSDVARVFSDVVRTHNLDQTHFVTLGTEAVRVMVGLATTKDFRAHLREQKLVADTAQDALASAVEQGMFKPVREAIVSALAQRADRG